MGKASPVLSRATGAALAAILAVYVARAFGAEYSGRFFFLVSSLTIMSVVTRLGAEPYLTARITALDERDEREAYSILFSTIVAVLILVATMAVVLTMIAAAAPDVTEIAYAGLHVFWIALSVIGLNTMWIVTGYTRARGMAGLSIFLETGLLSLWLLCVLIISKALSIEPSPVFVSGALALMCPILIALLAPRLWRYRTSLGQWTATKDALLGIGGFGSVTITNGIIVLIPLQVLGWMGMNHEAGVYNAGLRVSMLVGASGVVIKSLVVRQAADQTRSSQDRRLDIRRSVYIALPWMGFSALVAWQGDLVAKLFGADFSNIKSIILVMLLAQSVNVAGFLVEVRAVLANEQKLLNITSLATLSLALASTPMLVQAYRLQGAAASFALTIVFSRILLMWLYVRNRPRIERRAGSQRRRDDCLEKTTGEG